MALSLLSLSLNSFALTTLARPFGYIVFSTNNWSFPQCVAKSRHGGYMFCFCFLFICLLMIPVRPIISKSTRPMLAIFAEMVELWLWVVDLKFVFRSLKGHCHGSRFLWFYPQNWWVSLDACGYGAAGRANVRLCSASSFFIYTFMWLDYM